MHKNKLFIYWKSKRQALLIIVLVLSCCFNSGFIYRFKIITNLRTTQDQASSQKALSAAEAGAEQAIISQNKTTPITGSLERKYNLFIKYCFCVGSYTFLYARQQ